MITARTFLLAISPIGLVLLLVACREATSEAPPEPSSATSTAPGNHTPEPADQDSAPAEGPIATVTPVIVNGGTGPVYLEPVPLVPGKYESPLASLEAREQGMAALNAEKGKPQFEGVINGIRLWSYEHAFNDVSVMKVVCGGGDYVEWRLVNKLVFSYLPPGTAAVTPQNEAVCADGSVAWAGQHFLTDGPTFGIWYESGEWAFPQDAPAERVAAGKVQGRPAVIIRPLTKEGFGRTWVVFATKNGMIVVDAQEMPLAEALKIAEGIRCESC